MSMSKLSFMKQLFLAATTLVFCLFTASAQDAPQPGTRVLPARINPTPQPTRLPPPPVIPGAGNTTATPQAVTIPVQPQPVTPPSQVPPTVMSWDADTKEYTTKPGELEAHFTYYFTNVSKENLVVNSAAGSCGCTVPKLPPVPWTNTPGVTGEIPVTMNLAGKSGTVFKTVTVNTDHGTKILTVKVNITPAVANAAATPMDRIRNQQLAQKDRQKVFQGDCASCHGTPVTNGKLGVALFKSTCGVCHEAEHRATMVPDLHALNHDTNPDYWKTWISLGKPGSLMPGFAQSEGGPLSEAQINSLVQYLSSTIPAKAARPASGN